MIDYNYPEKVSLLDCSGSYSPKWMPENLQDAIDWLLKYRELIPVEHMGTAKIEISSDVSYDSSISNLEIWYSRPPSEEEINRRKKTVKEQQERNLIWAKQRLNEAENQLRQITGDK